MLTREKVVEIRERLLQFHKHLEERKKAVQEGKPYAYGLERTINENVLLIESLPMLLEEVEHGK